MMRSARGFWICGLAAALTAQLPAQGTQKKPGRSIGSIATQGNLIVMTLDDGGLGTSNLFDLAGRTVRFTPDGPGYRVETTPLKWDSDFGKPAGAQVTLRNFEFPFSGKSWNSFFVGLTGSIAFGGAPGGVRLARYDQLREAARNLVNTTPAICVFLKPRMSGPRYVKELADRVVITWSLTEPYGNIQDFTWTPTVNRFQAVLGKDGSVEMSYNEMAAKDAIVGLYPLVTGGKPAKEPEVHFSALTEADGPFLVVYESFHYLRVPEMRDLSCTVINSLGDKFDFLAYYSDFRVDNPEAGTPSDGPLGGGPAGGAVTGIGAAQGDLASYCTQGRFQWEFVQPVYVGSNQMQERPPEGLTDTNKGNIATYARQLGERTPDGKMLPFNYAISQIAHEMGHRWGAFVSAKVNGETIPLGPVPWATGLHAPVVFPYQRPLEASAMGGGVWQDNFDGTFTQLDDDYYVPATGWSHLDLYLMGLIAPSEVPDFFILRNLFAAGQDTNGHPIFKADRTKVTIEDVIATAGPRLPDVDHSQKKFNTGMVLIVEHGKKPSPELIERTNGIRKQWIDYWDTTTGHRSLMTAEVK